MAISMCRLLEGNLRDLARVNALAGRRRCQLAGAEATHEATPNVCAFWMLGTGAADIPRALVNAARKTATDLDVVATDVRPEIVAFAWQTAAQEPAFEVRLASANRIDEPDGSFHVVHASTRPAPPRSS